MGKDKKQEELEKAWLKYPPRRVSWKERVIIIITVVICILFFAFMYWDWFVRS